MTLRDALSHAPIVSLDAEILLAFVLGKDRAWILAHDDESLEETDRRLFEKFISRRMADEPVAYITGRKEFFGRSFLVTPDVLIPRPSTEVLVEEVLRFLDDPLPRDNEADTGITILTRPLLQEKPRVILDIGTGSGIIAITLALEGRTERIIGIDTSAPALVVAKENALRHNVQNIEFAEADGVEYVRSMTEPFFVVSNPPYIPVTAAISTGATYEPKAALFAGKNGLDVLVPLAIAAAKHPLCCGIALELRTDQCGAVRSANDNGILGT